jgi:hypothetical protein
MIKMGLIMTLPIMTLLIMAILIVTLLIMTILMTLKLGDNTYIINKCNITYMFFIYCYE